MREGERREGKRRREKVKKEKREKEGRRKKGRGKKEGSPFHDNGPISTITLIIYEGKVFLTY